MNQKRLCIIQVEQCHTRPPNKEAFNYAEAVLVKLVERLTVNVSSGMGVE